jgi:hypothetical protein
MYLDHLCRYMFPEYILYVSCISDTYLSGYIRGMHFRLYPLCIPAEVQEKKSLRKKGSQPSAKVHTSHKKEWRVLSAHGGDASIIVVLSNRM